ncbi:energy transducer TonB [Paraburkholderia sp. RL18-103-BIB-C]|jgi:protein TonB|uniref:energy transducer TonB n=1 Tax=unclassified Paraburkholderia TaxID=2615204 RepID=UPI0038BC6A0B
MSNIGRRSNTSLLDEPTTRIVIAVAIAFGLWCAALVLVGGLLVTPEITPPSPPNLDAQLVEIEPPPPATSTPAQAAPAHPAPPANIKHATPVPVHRATPVHLEPSQRAASHMAPPDSPSAPAAPPAPPAPPASAMPAESVANRSLAATDLAASGSGHTGARVITQPLPEIPDDLREAAYHALALARFTIHPDGSVDVELLQPTQQPRLNQLLLASLHNWRFFPATENGKPVESHQDVRVHLVVQ